MLSGKHRKLAALFGLIVLALLYSLHSNAFAPRPPAAARLPAFNVDITQTSVSGLSSGGFMAVQFQVAHSSILKGAGVIAGGPYFCATGDVTRAATICSCTHPFLSCQVSAGGTNVPNLIDVTNQNANAGAIDPPSRLANHKVYLFAGEADSKVPIPVMNDLEQYYRAFMSAGNIRYTKSLPPPRRANHGMPTDSFGNPCDSSFTPFINNCGFDAAGELLKWIYGNLNPRNTGTLSGRFVEFDQQEFIRNAASHGMAPNGILYVPASCDGNQPCKLHVAFHGCSQSMALIQDRFYKNTGYNQWADTNRMIVLYPQLALSSPNNPFGCWDWFAYDDPNYAKKNGRQVAAVRAMIDRIGGVSR